MLNFIRNSGSCSETRGKRQHSMRVCVVIPTYNESKAIGGLVKTVREEGFDVMVIDDGSSDNTVAIAKENGAAVITHEANKGKGASLKAGFGHALEKGYDVVVVMDGDGQHDPKDIKRFIKTAQDTGSDLVVGNRMNSPRAMPIIRQLTNKCLSILISKICGQTIPDTQCGFRLIKIKVLKNLQLISSKYEIESEILIRASKNRFKIFSIHIKSVYSGEVSTIHPIKDAIRFIRLMSDIKSEEKVRKG